MARKFYKDIDGVIYEYGADGSQDHLIGDKVVMTIEEVEAHINPPMTLEQAKSNKLQELETAYESAITADITYNNVVYQADLASQSLMAQNLSVGSVPTGFYWRALDNTKVPMTFTQLQGLASAIQARGMLAFDNKVNRKDAVNDATTIEAVNAVVW